MNGLDAIFCNPFLQTSYPLGFEKNPIILTKQTTKRTHHARRHHAST